MLLTRTVRGQRTRGRQLAASEVEKVRGELAAYREFAALAERIVEVNEAICEARPVAGTASPSVPGGEKGLSTALAAERSAEVGRLAEAAARALAPGGAGLAAAEAVIREGVLRLGGGILGDLLSADPGYRGPRVACGSGHEAQFAGYRRKGSQECTGPSQEQTPSSPCAAPRPASSGKPPATTRHQPPDQPPRDDDLQPLRTCRAPEAIAGWPGLSGSAL